MSVWGARMRVHVCVCGMCGRLYARVCAPECVCVCVHTLRERGISVGNVVTAHQRSFKPI